MTAGPLHPPPFPEPDPGQDADFAEELEALAASRVEPSEEELAGAEPPDDDGYRPCRDPAAEYPGWHDNWLAELGGRPGEFSPVTHGSGFAEGRPLDRLGPGAALAGFAGAVLDDGLDGLSDDELVGVLRASRRLAAWQDGIELAVVAEIDSRRVRASGRLASSRVDEQVSSELAAALVLTGRSADALLGLARDLARLPAVRRALLAGLIDLARARVFAEELAGLGDVAAAAIAFGFADIAGTMTTGQLRATLRAMVLSIDPAAARQRAENGKNDARVEAWQENSGNMGLVGRELAASDALAADKRLTAIAQALRDAGTEGTLDQLRAAVFIALLAGRDPDELLPVPASSQPGLSALGGTVHLIMPAAAWLGLVDSPGEAPGLGPLDAWTCRDLAARLAAGGPGTRWQVTLTGPDGRAVAHARARAGPGPPGPAGTPGTRLAWLGRLQFDWLERSRCRHPRQVLRYQPDDRLKNLVLARQRTCAFPGCRRPATRCDVDHTIAYQRGGRTCECNLSPLCRRHHHVKQADGWALTQPEPGVLTWTTPHGRSYTVRPERYPV